MTDQAFVAFGSNMGDRQATLARAAGQLKAAPGVAVRRASSLYETAPVGGPPQDHFLNAILEIETELDPDRLLETLQTIEASFNRRRVVRWGPRTLDLDIILFGERVINTTNLEIPHPRMAERRFVLEPLAEIAPDALHPVSKRKIIELLRRLPAANGDVRRLELDWA